MKRTTHGTLVSLFCLIACVLLLTSVGRAAEPAAKLLNVQRIWDQAPHNAFTDLVRFKDEWLCVFREGQGHVSPDGALRVIASRDGKQWQSVALITDAHADLRDAKLTITPSGRLMLSGAAAVHEPVNFTHQSYVWFSDNGRDWDAGIPVGDPNYWLWRTTWHGETAYSIGYGCGDQKQVRLYQSKDGRTFETLVANLYDQGYPNESSLVFLPDGRCVCLLRRDGTPSGGLFGIASAPYTDWKWHDVGTRIGGPQMLQLPDGRLVAAVRLHDPKVRTSLAWIDAETGKLTEFLALPSGGDCSYAGMVWHDNQLWVSYYSSHEGKTSIYLAQVELAL